MKPVVPIYSKTRLKKAGRQIAKGRLDSLFLTVIENWRAAHNYPLNTLQANIRAKIKRMSLRSDAIFAQRLKRMPTIINKISSREKQMCISRMEDIAGLRIILPNLQKAKKVYNGLLEDSSHKVRRCRDYVINPKESGYRGYHVIYSYNSRGRNVAKPYDGMFVEVQVRTVNQHAWATAVEIVGAFSGQALKSSQGSKDLLRFFEKLSKAIAILDGDPKLLLEKEKLYREVSELAKSVNIIDTLKAIRLMVGKVDSKKSSSSGHYFLIRINYSEKNLTWRRYSEERLVDANEDYANWEAEQRGQRDRDVVLVRVKSLRELKKAYPNYFGDTDIITGLINKIMKDANRLSSM